MVPVENYDDWTWALLLYWGILKPDVPTRLPNAHAASEMLFHSSDLNRVRRICISAPHAPSACPHYVDIVGLCIYLVPTEVRLGLSSCLTISWPESNVLQDHPQIFIALLEVAKLLYDLLQFPRCAHLAHSFQLWHEVVHLCIGTPCSVTSALFGIRVVGLLLVLR